MSRSVQASLAILTVGALLWLALPASPDEAGGQSDRETELEAHFQKLRDMSLEQRQARARDGGASHLLDRGTGTVPASRGGGPTGPLPIFYGMGSPTAVATTTGGTPMFPIGFFFPPGTTATGFMNGGVVGHLFPPAVPATPPAGYPMDWLTMGTAPGFSVTGVYAWNWSRTPALPPAGGGAGTGVLGVAAVTGTVGATMNAAGAASFTVAFVGLPNPSAVVGAPGNVGPVPITAAAPNVFCGLLVGGPGFFFGPPWLGNGLGGNLPPGPPGLPLRVGAGGWPYFTGTLAGVTVVPAPPANYIAGCYAAGATTPVELQSFHVD